MIIGCMGLGLEFCLCIHLESTGRTPLQFSLKLPEAFLYGVQYFLADMFLCFSVAGSPPGQLSQLIDLIVDHPNFILGCLWTNEIHSRGICPQISFRGGLSLVLANGPIVFLLPCDFGMGEHLMCYEWAVWPERCPPQTFIWNTLESRHLSTSLTEMPVSWSSFLVAVVLAV